MNALKFILLFLAILLTLTYCSTGPDFERDNTRDPKAGDYSPGIQNMSYEINKNQDVQLRWSENSIAEDGFLVQKNLMGHFNTIDTLTANSETYLDASKEFTPETFYRVIPFIIKDEAIKIDSSKIDNWTIKLSLGQYSNIEFTNEESIKSLKIFWEDKTSIPTSSVIEYKVENNWTVIDTLQSSYSEYSIDTSDIPYFLIDVRVTSLMKTFEGKLEPLNSLSLHDIELHYPTNIKIETVYEDEVVIIWNDNSQFESGFLVTHIINDEEEKFTISANETSFQTRIKASNDPHTFQVMAFKEDKKSKSTAIKKSIIAYPLSNIEVSHISEDQVKISWYNPWEGPEDITRNVLIERSEKMDGPFQVLDTLPPDANEFLDSNLNRNKTYYYKARSLSSRPTNTIAIRNLISLILDRRTIESATYLDNMVLTPDEKYLLNVNFDNRLLTEFDLINSTRRTKEFSNHVLEKIKISPNGKYLAIYTNIDNGDSHNRGPNAIIILDRNTFSTLYTLHSRNQGYQAFDFSHSSDELIIYDYDNESDIEEVVLYDLNTGTLKNTVHFESIGCGESLFRSQKEDVYIINCYNKFYLFDSITNERELLVDEESWISASTIQGDNLFYSTESLYKLNLATKVKEEVASYEYNFYIEYLPINNSIIYGNGWGTYMKHLDFDYNIELDNFEEPRFFYLKDSNQLLIRDNAAFNYYNFENIWSTIITSN